MSVEAISKQELETFNSKLEESPGLDFFIWNTVDKYFKTSGVFEPFSDVITRAFGTEIGSLIEKLFEDKETVFEFLKDSNMKYRHFFSSILESYYDETVRFFLFDKNPQSLYQLAYTTRGNEDILRLIRADNASFDIALVPHSYKFLIKTLLNSYSGYSESPEKSKLTIISDLTYYKDLIDGVITKLTIPGGE